MDSGTKSDCPKDAAPRPGARRAGIRLHLVLIVPFLALLAPSVGLIGWMSFRNGQRAVEDLSRRLLSEVNARIVDHLDAFLSQPRRINRLNADAIAAGAVPASDLGALQRHFLRQIRAYESVSSAYFGNAAGGMANAGREGAAGALYFMGTEGFAAGRLYKRAVDGEGRPGAVLATVPSFDARTRPWFQDALRRGGASWTEPYVLSTGQDMAISASLPVRDASGGLLGVASVDIFLSQLDAFMRGLPVGRTGKGFIMERSGLLVASSDGEKPFAMDDETRSLRRLEARRSASPAVREAAEALVRRFGDLASAAAEQEWETTGTGARAFLQASPFRTADGLDWLVVTVLPESDFMEHIRANNRATLLTIAVALAVAVTFGIVTARLVAKPVRRLNESTKGIVRGAWGAGIVENVRILEIRELTDSFHAMVARLRRVMESLTSEVEERKQAEAAMRRNERKLRCVIEQSVDGIVLADEKGRVVEWNRAMESITGLPGGEALGRPLWEVWNRSLSVERLAPEAARRIEGALSDFLQTGTFPESLQGVSNLQIAGLDGETVAIESAIFPIRTEDGFMLGALVRDVTERRRAERERERLIGELQAAVGEVKHLSGLLPICSRCKKIRDDRGYWHQVEVYIRDHAEVVFTHGLCPECAAKYYTEAGLSP